MSIDWITVLAQIANFLVLVWLLKRFLYRPILDGIDAREREIAERMSEADRIREEAKASEADFQAQVVSLSHDREELMEETRQAAEAERDTLLADARRQIARERQERAEQRARETLRYSQELHQTGAQALLALTRKALNDLADETLEQRIVSRAAARSADLIQKHGSTASDHSSARLSTQSPLPEELQLQLRAELTRKLPARELSFHVNPDQSPGLILHCGGAQLGWTVDSYMDGLEELLHDGLSRRTRGITDAS